MKVVSVVGARPQFVKLAPVAAALTARGHEHVIVHTGQHYDAGMSEVFFADLRIPAPTVNLAVGSAGHATQTGRMLEALEPVLVQAAPDWVLVYGDTNSTLAAAVAAVKVHLPLAHLESGLRSFDRAMPEEHNRVMTDHAADLCLAPTDLAMRNLATEGLAARSRLVGDVMVDVCLAVAATAAGRSPLAGTPDEALVAGGDYLLATIHRQENTDDPARLLALLQALAGSPTPVLLLAHPRLVATAAREAIELAQGAVRVHPPQAYPDLVALVVGSRGVVTDSGGLQKEAMLLRTPAVTVRSTTEWTETVELGWNRLAPDADDLAQVLRKGMPQGREGTPYGSGDAAVRAVAALETG